MTSLVLVLLASALSSACACYWNAECPFLLHSSKTPYDTIRGDIRDHATPQNCEAVSIWSLNRHGNRNPGDMVTAAIKHILFVQNETIDSYYSGNSQLCAQDIENFKKWSWNTTIETTMASLTSTGYEEMFDIGSRIREKYPHLLQNSSNPEDYYFRPFNEQRTITSAVAFLHGLTLGTGLQLASDEPREIENILRPYEYCDRYQHEVIDSEILSYQVNSYYETAEFIAVLKAVQKRLGIPTKLNPDEICALYEICRFDRSWTAVHKSPWCAAFSNEDLVVLEYRDDFFRYYRNGYGSWVNVYLGRVPLKDLYENFEASIAGKGKKIVSYFSHATMMEMVYSAMGVFKDATPLQGSYRNPNRKWRLSTIGAFAANIIAVLNRCEESGTQTYRVQLFINEKVSEVCPPEGCTWEQFQEKFERFKSANLDFCSMDSRVPVQPEASSALVGKEMKGFFWFILVHVTFLRFWS